MTDDSQILQPDATFGKHRIVRLLGRGGMGEVYEVVDPSTGNHLALKLLSQEVMAVSGAQDLFEREAKIMMEMDHPGIVKVLDAGVTKERRWIGMELMSGWDLDGHVAMTLGDYVRHNGGMLPQGEVGGILSRLLDAIGHAHGKGLVHRDIKPANLLLGANALKIADFGIATATAANWLETKVRNTVLAQGDDPTLIDPHKRKTIFDHSSGSGSPQGAMMGTFAYMSPEQQAGSEVDPRSDLYGLGLIAFQMLTGKTKVKFKSPSQISTDIDSDWDSWIEKALEDDPKDRFASAREMFEHMPYAMAFTPQLSSSKPAAYVIEEQSVSSPSTLPKPQSETETSADPTPQPKPERVAAPRQPVRGSSPATAKPASQYRSGVVWALALILVAVGLFAWSPWSEDKERFSEDEKTKPESASFSAERPKPSPPEPEPARPMAPTLRGEPTEGKAFALPELELEMLWCKPGTFTMGSPASEADRRDDETQHAVTLTEGFWLGKYEVTQAQWEEVMGSNPSEYKGANLPVEHVSWNEVTSFCAKLTERERKAGRLPEGYAYQLPTEAQWEYACRAGTKTAYSFGNSITTKQANFDILFQTKAVGSYPANSWGFHDMHGNVWEWCQDRYGDYPSGSVSDPMGPAVSLLRVFRGGSDRVLRGGSWQTDAQSLRSASRVRDEPDYRSIPLGFRVSLRLVEAGPKEQEKEKVAVSVNAGKAFTIRDLQLAMLWCKPGTFTMGSPTSEADRRDDETQHAVTLTEGFWLGKYEVTQAQWHWIMGTYPSYFEGAYLPMETVSWDDAVSFCAKLTDRERKAGRLPNGYAYQLPTEAQWEYACRAGTRTAWSFAGTANLLHRHANYADKNLDQLLADQNTDFPWLDKLRDDGHGYTAPVGSYPANAWGFHDLHGNVSEWCQDRYGDYPSGSVSDPMGSADGSARVFRGGSWGGYAQLLRSAYRHRFEPGNRHFNLGFRVSLRLVQGKAE